MNNETTHTNHSAEHQEHAKPGIMQKLEKHQVAFKNGIIIFIVAGLLLGLVYWYFISQRVYSDKAEISAPLITLSPTSPDALDEIMVKTGDQVVANQAIAKMENGFVRAKTDGLIVGINNQVGTIFNPGATVATMINPDDLRVVAHIAEDKGLSQIKPGQKVIFTVDAFDGQEFNGVIDEIVPTSDQTSVVFSISDKRIEKEFSVKIKFDPLQYPMLLNGMSAKVWIYKN